jgi:hypothetical protein
VDSLLGFATFTKGVEYLIAVGFLITFVVFWQLVYGKGKRRFMTAGVLAYLVLGIGFLVASRITSVS